MEAGVFVTGFCVFYVVRGYMLPLTLQFSNFSDGNSEQDRGTVPVVVVQFTRSRACRAISQRGMSTLMLTCVAFWCSLERIVTLFDWPALAPCVASQFKGIPSEVEVDMSKPEEGRMSKAGQVLVDLATKRVY